MNNKSIIFATLIFIAVCTLHPKKMIVGLIAVKNEQNCIKQCLRAFSLYTDAIVLLDDVSEDNTLSVVNEIKATYNIHIIQKTEWARDEAKDRNALLEYGRSIGGTHFIILDADEMMTAQCAHNNYLKKKIYELEPGEWISCSLIDLYENAENYIIPVALKGIAFCDNDTASFDEDCRIHSKRIPEGINKREYILEPPLIYGLLHFKYVNWENVEIRNFWYQHLIATMWPDIPRKHIRNFYEKKLEEQKSAQLKPVNPDWFDYPFFNLQVFFCADVWRWTQINQWAKEYGPEYFEGLTPFSYLSSHNCECES